MAISCGGAGRPPQTPPISVSVSDAAGAAGDAGGTGETSTVEPHAADAPLAEARVPEPNAAPDLGTPDATAPDTRPDATAPDTRPDAPAPDTRPDAPAPCTPSCTPGDRRCGPGGGLQLCALVDNCAVWAAESPCGGSKLCRPAGAASAFCTCPNPPPPCPATPGTLCDARGEVVMCGLDDSGCVTVSKRVACAAGRPCVGSFPMATCSCPRPPAECPGAGSFCASGGALATCALDASGCIAIARTEVCAAGRNCRGSFPTATCQCQAPDAGQACGKCGGVLTCEGACTVPTPANHGADCGLCGGRIGCNGTCSVPTPANHGAPCGACGGKIGCDGACSVPTPANHGALCGACGTIQCDSTCSRPAPPSQLQHVNAYQGDLGPSRGFVRMYKYPVGAIEQTGMDASDKLCSGTLIGRDRFLTSGRCIDGSNATSRFVVFNYERLAGSTTLAQQRHYPIIEVLEDERGGFDYAIVRLGDNPGDTFGWARVSAVGDHGTGQTITLIQHPAGGPKQVEAGAIQGVSGSEILYTDVETTTGSAGAGVLDDSGELLAVHTGTECAAGTVRGKAVRLSALRAASPIIGQLLLQPGPRTVQGDVHVATSNGSAFRDRGWRWADWHCVFGETCAVGDVTGDKRADLVSFQRSNLGDVHVANATDTGFESPTLRHDYMCAFDEECTLADVNGDGRQDLTANSRLVPENPADVWVALATGDGFGAPAMWSDYLCVNGEILRLR